MTQFTPTFFPTKGDFNPTDFEQTISTYGLDRVISQSCLCAWESVKNYTSTEFASYRTIGSMLHDAFFHQLEMILNQHPRALDITMTRSISGNDRETVRVGQYIFVAKLEGSCANKTFQQEIITNQDAEQHIITICYALDEMRTAITSISLDYVKQKETIYRMSIPLSYSLQTSMLTTAQSIEPTHPTLKAAQKRQAQ